MSDSNSRYSIVKELTEQKLNLLDQLNSADTEATRLLVEAEEIISSTKEYADNAMKQIDRDVAGMLEKAARLKVKAEALKQNKASKEKATNDKIAAIDSALRDLKEISQLSLKQESDKNE